MNGNIVASTAMLKLFQIRELDVAFPRFKLFEEKLFGLFGSPWHWVTASLGEKGFSIVSYRYFEK